MKYLKTYLAICLLCIANHVSAQFCTNDDRFTEVEVFTNAELGQMLDVTYGNAPDWQGNAQDLKMDIFYPLSTVDPMPQRPFILIVHGGGFTGGNKASKHNVCRDFAKRGYVAASLEYRLGWNTSNPNGQIIAAYRAQQDANAAWRYIAANAATFGIDTNWMFMGGSSAGGVTSLFTNYVTQLEWNALVPGIQTQEGGLTTSGNTLTNTFTLQGIFNEWGATAIGTMQAAEMIPTISFHGFLDNTVPFNNGTNGLSGSGIVHNELVNNGVCSELNVDSLGGHGVFNDASTGREFRDNKAICFFKNVFCNTCATNYYTEPISANCSVACLPVDLNILFDGFPSQTSWDITDSNGNVVSSGGSYVSQPGNSILTSAACLPDDCYTLNFYDALNNGMCPFRVNAIGAYTFTTPGTLITPGTIVGIFGVVVSPGLCGTYNLTDATGDTIVIGGGPFGASESNSFCIAGGVPQLFVDDEASYARQIPNSTESNTFHVYPNPTEDILNIQFEGNTSSEIELNIIDITGKIIHTETRAIFDSNIQLTINNLNSGIYFIQIIDNKKMMTEKFVVK